VTLQNCRLTLPTTSSGGAAIEAKIDGKVVVARSDLMDNTCTNGWGGALSIFDQGVAELEEVRVSVQATHPWSCGVTLVTEPLPHVVRVKFLALRCS
jgi:hypothetical protein